MPYIHTTRLLSLTLSRLFSLHPLLKVTWYRAGWVRDISSHPRSTVPAAVRRPQSRIRVLRAAICPFCSRPSRIRPPRRSARLLWPPLVLPVAASSGAARRGSSPSGHLQPRPSAPSPPADVQPQGSGRPHFDSSSSAADRVTPASIHLLRPPAAPFVTAAAARLSACRLGWGVRLCCCSAAAAQPLLCSASTGVARVQALLFAALFCCIW